MELHSTQWADVSMNKSSSFWEIKCDCLEFAWSYQGNQRAGRSKGLLPEVRGRTEAQIWGRLTRLSAALTLHYCRLVDIWNNSSDCTKQRFSDKNETEHYGLIEGIIFGEKTKRRKQALPTKHWVYGSEKFYLQYSILVLINVSKKKSDILFKGCNLKCVKHSNGTLNVSYVLHINVKIGSSPHHLDYDLKITNSS